MRASNLSDSRVCIGAFAKGRSSSKSLNSVLRSTIPAAVAGKRDIGQVWVGTKHNSSDHPTRFKDIPAPTDPPDSLLAHYPGGVSPTQWDLEHRTRFERGTRKVVGSSKPQQPPRSRARPHKPDRPALALEVSVPPPGLGAFAARR